MNICFSLSDVFSLVRDPVVCYTYMGVCFTLFVPFQIPGRNWKKA